MDFIHLINITHFVLLIRNHPMLAIGNYVHHPDETAIETIVE